MARTPGTRGRSTPDRRGRVTYIRYTQGVADEICARLAQGMSWNRLAGQKDMPSYSTMYNWRKKRADFSAAVDAARAMGAEYSADRAVEVAERATRETVQQDRLLVGTLMKHAALAVSRTKAGGRPAKETPVKVEYVFHVRQFEKVIGPDGRAYVRELKPDGEA